MVRVILIAPALCALSVHSAFSQCLPSQETVSVEHATGDFCVEGPRICSANVNDGNCPLAQEGLPGGSYCGVVASGVYGCKLSGAPTNGSDVTTTNSEPATETPTPLPDWRLLDGSQCASTDRKLLVIANEDVFCMPATARACYGDYAADMTCPGPQLRLPYGSSCRFIGDSDSVGCYPNSASGPAGGYEPIVLRPECKLGLRVQGQGGYYCVDEGTRCQSSDGLCPYPQQGLPFGSSCREIEWGYFGCYANSAPPSPPVTTAAPSAPSTTATPSLTATSAPGFLPDCGAGNSPMSVEGVVPNYCVSEPACVADQATGNCPGPQRGLPFGSSCGIIQSTGVYGCKPNSQ